MNRNHDQRAEPDLTVLKGATRAELTEWGVEHVVAPDWMVQEGLADKGQMVWADARTGAVIG